MLMNTGPDTTHDDPKEAVPAMTEDPEIDAVDAKDDCTDILGVNTPPETVREPPIRPSPLTITVLPAATGD